MTRSKILIVDDEPFNVDYLEQELEESNYATASAFNGRQALEKLTGDLPDLVLLDIMMPVMDGFEVLTRLRANPATRDIPVIIISANSEMNSIVRGIQLGAEDYLPKPFEPALLHARISSSLEKKHLRDVQKLYLKSLEREFEIAREIQAGFLPDELPQVAGWEIAAYFKAAREVAGDFYDAFTLEDGSLACVIGDVCGKGVGAALFMTLFRSLIRAASTTSQFSGGNSSNHLSAAVRLQQVMSFTNQYIAETHAAANMFATVFIGIINLHSGLLTYMNCGNESPLILRNGAVVASLPPTGPVVGIFSEAVYKVEAFSMEPEDLFLAFTDGVPDAIDPHGTIFGHERFHTLLQSSHSGPAEVLKKIVQGLNDFASAADQFDDITVLAVNRCS